MGKENRELELKDLKVSVLLDPNDVDLARTALSRAHVLGTKKTIGHYLYYAVSYRGEWVAVLLFDQAIDFQKYRDREIGWSTEQIRERRCHVANNSRFCLSPSYRGQKNLASKVLSLVTKQISKDWERKHGVPLLAVESYVDPEHNENDGVCYRAAGWDCLGLSSGYVKKNGERTHGKWYYLKSLHPKSYEALRSEYPHPLLGGIKPVSGESNNVRHYDVGKLDLEKMKKALSEVKDPRSQQGVRYQFVPLMLGCIGAVLCGYTQYEQMRRWIKGLGGEGRVRLGLPGDLSPSESTIRRTLQRVDPKELTTSLTELLLETYNEDKRIETLCIDGKAQRGSSKDPKKQVGFLSVYATEAQIVISADPAKKGGGEKEPAKNFVKENEEFLVGKTILADAMHTDKEFIAELEKKSSHTSLRSKVIRRPSKKRLDDILNG